MMKNRYFVLATVAAALIFTPVQAKRALSTVSSDYNLSEWSIQNDPVAKVAYGLENVGGLIAVCGGYAMLPSANGTHRALLPKFFAKRSFEYDGKSLGLSAAHFKRIRGTGVLGQSVKCRTTKIKWREGLSNKKLKFRTKRVTVYD